MFTFCRVGHGFFVPSFSLCGTRKSRIVKAQRFSESRISMLQTISIQWDFLMYTVEKFPKADFRYLSFFMKENMLHMQSESFIKTNFQKQKHCKEYLNSSIANLNHAIRIIHQDKFSETKQKPCKEHLNSSIAHLEVPRYWFLSAFKLQLVEYHNRGSQQEKHTTKLLISFAKGSDSRKLRLA